MTRGRSRGCTRGWSGIGPAGTSPGANLPEALRSYRDGLAISDRLAKADPGNAGWQRDVAISHANLAGAYRRSGDLEQARSELDSGRAIMAGLVAKFPDWAEWKNDLTWFDGQLAALK